MRRLLLAACLVCGLARTASATTYYVAQSGGSDANSCATAQSSSTPKLTITSGLTCLSGGGDTLLVRTGTYVEKLDNNVPSGTSWSSYVRIAAYPGTGISTENVTLRPSSGHWVVHFGNDVGGSVTTQKYIEFDGINIDAANIDDSKCVFLDTRNGSTPNHIRWKNSDLHNIEAIGGTAACVAVGGGTSANSFAESTDNEFTNNVVHGTGGPYGYYLSGSRNTVDGGTVYGVSSLCVHIYQNGGTPDSNVVKNLTCRDITQSGFFGAPDTRTGGILMAGTNNVAYNNLIYHIRLASGTPAPYGGILFYAAGTGRQAYNNTIDNVDGYAYQVDTPVSGAVIKNSIAYGNDHDTIQDNGTGTVSQGNLFGVNPLFVNSAAGDFHLQAGSPAINTGVAISGLTTDLAGAVRPQGGAYDAGAYEFGGAVAATYYVSSSTGDDTRTTGQAQSTSTPWATIQKCANSVVSGDTCSIRAGTYAGFTAMANGTPTAPITFQAFAGETVNITAATGTVVGTNAATDLINLSNRAYVVVDSLHLNGNSTVTLGIEGYAASFLTIKNSEVQLALHNGIYFEQLAHDITVQSCLLHDNSQENHPRGTTASIGGGLIAGFGSYNLTIKQNAVYRNDGDGINFFGHVHDSVIDGNVVSDNWRANIFVDSVQAVAVKNNVVFNTAASITDASCIATCGLGDPVGLALTTGAVGTTGTDANLTDLTIVNNVIKNCSVMVSRFATGSATPDSNWLIAHNTFILSVDGVTPTTGASTVSTLSIRNNIWTGTLGASKTFLNVAVLPSSSTLGTNDYHITSGTASWTWGGTTTSTFATYTAAAGEANSITSDPLLVSESASIGTLWGGSAVSMATILAAVDLNFTLQSTSPARDTGAILVAVATDRTGITRPNGSTWDMGAYEYVAPASGPPTITFVGVCYGGDTSSAGTIVSTSCSHAPGHLLVAFSYHDNAVTINSLANTAGDTWTQAGSTLSTLDSSKIDVYYTTSTHGSAGDVLTWTLSAATTYRGFAVFEFANAATSSVLINTASATGTSTSASSGSITIAQNAVEVSFGYMVGVTTAIGAGFTGNIFAFTGDANTYFFEEYKIVSTNQAATATGNTGHWGVFAAAFKEATAAAVVTTNGRVTLLGVGR